VHDNLAPEEDGGVADFIRVARITDTRASDLITPPIDTLALGALLSQTVRENRGDSLHQLLNLRVGLVKFQPRDRRQDVLHIASHRHDGQQPQPHTHSKAKPLHLAEQHTKAEV
jgi:hypothetical protein